MKTAVNSLTFFFLAFFSSKALAVDLSDSQKALDMAEEVVIVAVTWGFDAAWFLFGSFVIFTLTFYFLSRAD